MSTWDPGISNNRGKYTIHMYMHILAFFRKSTYPFNVSQHFSVLFGSLVRVKATLYRLMINLQQGKCTLKMGKNDKYIHICRSNISYILQ